MCGSIFEEVENLSNDIRSVSANTPQQEINLCTTRSAYLALDLPPGASGRDLPPVTGRSRVRVAVSSHCTGGGKACH